MAHQAWACRNVGCDTRWHRIGDALICQCARPRCRQVVAVITATPPANGLSPRALDALQNTDGRPALDWPGCID